MRITFGRANELGDFACFINPKYVVALPVVEFAVEKAVKNWNRGKRISKSLVMEILLYYSATRQIEVAKKLTGIGKVVAVVLDEERFSMSGFKEENFKPDYDIEAIKEHYGITDEELEIVGAEKLPLLLKERIALFSLLGE
ncbi:MAG: KEOPS complex subunit Cgi121 [Archaeoglobaceae archaeon]